MVKEGVVCNLMSWTCGSSLWSFVISENSERLKIVMSMYRLSGCHEEMVCRLFLVRSYVV